MSKLPETLSTPAALDAWAEDHSVQPWLQSPLVHVLENPHYPHTNWERWIVKEGSKLNLRQALLMPISRTRSGKRGQIAPAARKAAVDYLNDMANLARKGASEDKTRRKHRNRKGVTGDVQRHLRAEYRRIQSTGVPRFPERVQPNTQRLIDPETLTLTFRSFGISHCPTRSSRMTILMVSLRGDLGLPTVRCQCSEGDARCPLALWCLEQAERFIVEEATDALKAQLAVPLWQRVLDSVDNALVVREDPEDRRPGWRLSAEPGKPLSLAPVLVRPLKTKAGLRFWTSTLTLFRDGQVPGLSAVDKRIAQRLLASHSSTHSTHGYTDYENALILEAITLLVDHPAVFLGKRSPQPITVRRVTPGLTWEATDDGGVCVTFDTDGSPLSISDLANGRSAGGTTLCVNPELGLCSVMELPHGAAELAGALCGGSPFPEEATDALLSRLSAIHKLLPITLDETLQGEEQPPNDWPIARLKRLEDGGVEAAFRVEPLPGASLQIPGQGQQLFYGLGEDDLRVFTQRDLAEEREQLTADIAELGQPQGPPSRPFTWTLETPESVLALMDALERHDDLFEVEWDGPALNITRSASASDLRVTVGMQHDWFGIEGTLDVDGVQVSLLALFAAAREGRDIIQVGSGDWVRLTETFREQLNAASGAVFEAKGGRMEVSPLNVPVVAALAEHGAAVEAPPQWLEALTRIREADALDTRPPAALQATLRPYKQEGWSWLARLTYWSPGGCLADDMGLGKTVQALTVLLYRQKAGPALVVGPTSVGFNWLRECQRFAPTLKPTLYRNRDRKTLLNDLAPGDVLITSYDLMARDREALEAVHFGTVIFDEAQAIKNANTKRARAASALDAEVRIALSGTPVENRTSELWSLFNTVTPGLLGSWERFRTRFATPIEKYNDTDAQAALAAFIRPFILRRTKSEVAIDLPPRLEIREEVELSKRERSLYEQARLEAVARLAGGAQLAEQQRRFQVLAAITKLRQLACNPRLINANSTIPSAKLERLRERVGELKAEGHRALIFSQFTRHLALVREALLEDGVSLRYLDGSTPMNKRGAEVDAFQAGEGDVFLISLKAGGTGLNLTAANYVIHMDPWWNPAVEDQATDRAHRIGQSRAVTVYRMIAVGTIEESILEMHAKKRALVEGLLEGSGQSATLSADELMAMLQQR